MAQTTDGVTHAMRGVSAAAKETQDSSRTVLGSAEKVAGISGSLQTEVEVFLAVIRTGQQHDQSAA